MDLVIFYSPEKASITYYINSDSAGYKIEYPFAHIRSLTLQGDTNHPEMELHGPRPAGLVIELLKPPEFWMDHSSGNGFHQVADFTEDQQASSVLIHHLGGHPRSLQGQLTKLRNLDSFRNRLVGREGSLEQALPEPVCNAQPMVQATSGPVSSAYPVIQAIPAPIGISPPAVRPQSAAGLIGGPMAPPPKMLAPPMTGGPRGHKRQRSRSVPLPHGFSSGRPLHQAWHHEAMSTFSPMRPDDLPLFAPAPQYHPAVMNSLGQGIAVDISSGFGLNMSDNSLPVMGMNDSPPSFVEPSELLQMGNQQHGFSTGFGPMFSMPYMGPHGDAMRTIGQSLTPMSEMSHHDPVIANHSPPMHRNDSLDFFSGPNENTETHEFNDSSFTLSEHFSKQTLDMPLQSPGMNDLPPDFDMQSMLSFPIDSASLSPEQYPGLQVPISEV